MSDPSPVIVWFRRDLRIADNPALMAAAETGRPVVPLYILDDAPGPWTMGGAARWWLDGSLRCLQSKLSALGAPLTLRCGPSAEVLAKVVAETGATAVYWNRCYEPDTIARDTEIKRDLKGQGLNVESFNASLLFEPWTVQTKTGGFYKVYTRFWHACRDKGTPPPPLAAPNALIPVPDSGLISDALDDWALAPTTPDWAGGLRRRWTPGEDGAMARLQWFLDGTIDDYNATRDFPAIDGTSNLSAFLHAGDIGPRQVWAETVARHGWTGGVEKFLKELVWREFAYHVFYHLPHLPERPMYDKFADFPWREDAVGLRAWQRGMTGYPMVDAGMRELWQTGHMHNRVRMIVGSFLVKHLLLPWQAGEEWFWDTLVDADLAVNAFSWQWIGGCGADAAPYFRIFNPITQGTKFDPDGDYVRRYVPELAGLPNKYLCQPWEAPADILREAGVVLGETYPAPIVGHKAARERALAAFKSLPSAAQQTA